MVRPQYPEYPDFPEYPTTTYELLCVLSEQQLACWSEPWCILSPLSTMVYPKYPKALDVKRLSCG